MKIRAKNKRVEGSLLLLIIALPFAAFATYMAYLAVSSVIDSQRMHSWEQVPATILSTELARHRGSKGSTSYKAKATYTYRYRGIEYRGDRVSIYSGGDNFGDYQHNTYATLKSYHQRGEAFPAYVNPQNPTESILFPELRYGILAVFALFATIFGTIGYGTIYFVFWSARYRRKEQQLEQNYPNEPWNHRPEWNSGTIVSSDRSGVLVTAIFALIWNGVSLPLVFIIPREVAKGNALAVVGLLFPLVGIGLLGLTAYMILRWSRFGRSYLTLRTNPARLGGTLEGEIQISVPLPKQTQIKLKLVCEKITYSGSGKRSKSRSETLWHSETTVQPAVLMAMPTRNTQVPVSIPIPLQLPASSSKGYGEHIKWSLTASAEIPGVDYSALFEVPVFAG
jgi:Protein of unknown function (DUF3592)